MKKLMVALAGLTIAIILTGCGYKYQPRIYFYPDGWETNRTEIHLPYGTDVDYGHTFDTTQTEDGFDMTINFVTKEKEE